jgi:hypothetical protein
VAIVTAAVMILAGAFTIARTLGERGQRRWNRLGVAEKGGRKKDDA